MRIATLLLVSGVVLSFGFFACGGDSTSNAGNTADSGVSRGDGESGFESGVASAGFESGVASGTGDGSATNDGGTGCAYSGSWSLISSLVPSDAGPSGIVASAIDKSGDVLAAGYDMPTIPGLFQARIRRVIAGTATWTTANDVASFDSLALTIDGTTGDLFSTGIDQWILERSTDRGANWSTVDLLEADAGGGEAYYYTPTSIVSDAAGNLYAAGTYYPNGVLDPNDYHAIVRKSTDHGATWTLADDFHVSVAGSTFGEEEPSWRIVADEKGNLFAYGLQPDAASVPHFYVRKSANAGASWATVDDVSGAASQGNQIDFSGDTAAFGNGIVILHAKDTSASTLFLRSSVNGGTTWAATDSDAPFGTRGIEGMLFDPTTKTFFTFGDGVTAGHQHWIVRSTVDGTTWTTNDDYYPAGAAAATAWSGILDANSNLVVAGSVDATAIVIRVSPDHGKTWNAATTLTIPSETINYEKLLMNGAGDLFLLTGGHGIAAPWQLRRLICH